MHTIVCNVALMASIFHEALKHFIARVFICKGALLAVILFTVVFVNGGGLSLLIFLVLIITFIVTVIAARFLVLIFGSKGGCGRRIWRLLLSLEGLL